MFDLHSDLPFLHKRKKSRKCNKLLCNIYDKENYVVHIRTLKQALKSWINTKNVHKAFQFNQEAWLKSYVRMNTKLRIDAKNNFEKDFLKLMNNAVFGKTMDNAMQENTDILN